MSLPADLSATQRAAYMRALAEPTSIFQTVQMFTLSHTLVSSVTPIVTDGQVNYGGETTAVRRTLQVGFLDPDRAVRLDGDSPTEGVAGLNRLVRVTTHVWVDELERFASCAIFTGRPSVVTRDGDTVTVEAQDKACLHLRTVSPYSIAKGTKTVTAIRRILENGGERRFRFPSTHASSLAKAVSVGGPDETRQPWLIAQVLARRVGMQLFYDGDGYACLRKPPTSTSHTLVESGTGANLLERVRHTTDLTTIRNRVVVTGHSTGQKARRGRKAVKSRALVEPVEAVASHPFSPSKLAINGVPWRNSAYYDEPTLHTVATVRAFARGRLTELLTESVDVETKAVPVFHLEPGDLLKLKTNGDTLDFRLKDASVPLGASTDGMTVGYQQRVRSASAGRIGA